MELNPKTFYFGQIYDLQARQALPDQICSFDPQDLTTHGVITGMTGSGKTGMGIILLEEAAIKGIPAILIDPKGDLTNHLLHFPNLLPSDFAPWVDADAARRDGKTPEQAAEEASASWQKGLANAGIDKERMEKLANSVDYAIYTPGSDAGIPVSILSSLKAPKIPWEANKEALREAIGSTVTALLQLVGFKDIDPVRSREHILLANIFEFAWSRGKDLDLETLVLQVQDPPFDKLGVFPVSKFYPEKDRFVLAMQLNNFMAAPSFGNWLEGQPLDIAAFLRSPDGKARHSVFYLAHLADQERMFFITLLYSAIETWMRAQSGTSDLRALVYFDEIVGYLPPVANPPSKTIILRLLKQARAFGVGLVVATQNPIDLDYKALSNTGTWIIGKLQTDQDKQRLLDGLDSVAGGFDRAFFDKTISSLGKRVFLLHNVHAKAPQIFTTRWAMNYLPGPLTRNKIMDLNNLVGANAMLLSALQADASSHVSAQDLRGGASQGLPGKANEPVFIADAKIPYLPANVSLGQAVSLAEKAGAQINESPRYHYQGGLLVQGTLYFANRSYGINTEKKIACCLPALEGRSLPRWEEYPFARRETITLDPRPIPGATFADLAYPFDDPKNMAAVSKDFLEWAYRKHSLTLFTWAEGKLTSQPGESREAFESRCRAQGSGKQDDRAQKIRDAYARKQEAIKVKRMKEQLELEKEQKILNQRRAEEAGTGLNTVLGLLGVGKRRSLSGINSSLSKRRMTSTAKSNLEESEEMIKVYDAQLAELDRAMEAEIAALQSKALDLSTAVTETILTPLKKDVVVDFCGLIWIPQYAFKLGEGWFLVPAYQAPE